MTGPRVLLCVAVPDGSGVPTMALMYAIALREAGWRPILVLGGGAAGSDEEAGYVERVKSLGIEYCVEPRLGTGLVRSAASLARTASGRDAAALLAFHPRDHFAVALTGLFGLRVPRMPVVGFRHHFDRPPLSSRLKRGALGWSYRHSARILAASPKVATEIETGFSIAREHLSVVPNCIDGEREESIKRAQVRPGVRFVNVARVTWEKGHDVLLEAWDRAGIDGAELMCVGGVPFARDREAMLEKSAELVRRSGSFGPSRPVRFLGWRGDVASLLADSDVYVHASISEGPSLCVAILEAMAVGLPVICTDCAGWPDGFENGRHGYVVPAGDPEALGKTIRAMSELSPARRAEMGRNARNLQRTRYSIDSLSRRLDEVLRDLVGQPRS